MKKPKNVTIKTGTIEEFMENARDIMRAADRGEPIKPSHTITFVDPLDMLRFLSEAKVKLINTIRRHPDSITNIAKIAKRDRASVCRDIHEMEKVGLVQMCEEINHGHGRHKIVKLVASSLKLEAYI